MYIYLNIINLYHYSVNSLKEAAMSTLYASKSLILTQSYHMILSCWLNELLNIFYLIPVIYNLISFNTSILRSLA